MIVMTPHAPTQGEENFIHMFDHKSVLNKKKHHPMIAINKIAMPSMGVTTKPKTTSFLRWSRNIITNHILMLMIKVTKNNLGVISGIIHDTTNVEEETRQMLQMRKPTMDVVKNLHNLVKIIDNTIIAHQVNLVFKRNTNPML
jgi:uncharacterized protein involved in tolerance to divalent cations